MTEIFRKAKKLVDEGRVEVVERTFEVTYYRVKSSTEHDVRVGSDRTLTCSCQAFALEGHKGKLCSHAAAVIAVHVLRTPLEKRQP